MRPVPRDRAGDPGERARVERTTTGGRAAAVFTIPRAGGSPFLRCEPAAQVEYSYLIDLAGGRTGLVASLACEASAAFNREPA